MLILTRTSALGGAYSQRRGLHDRKQLFLLPSLNEKLFRISGSLYEALSHCATSA